MPLSGLHYDLKKRHQFSVSLFFLKLMVIDYLHDSDIVIQKSDYLDISKFILLSKTGNCIGYSQGVILI